jgi:hypothetical protein
LPSYHFNTPSTWILIPAARHSGGDGAKSSRLGAMLLIDGLGFEVASVTAASARRIATARA